MSRYDTPKIESTKYLCLTAMLRARETSMVTPEKAEQMLAAASFEEACRVAVDCGYPDMSAMGIREIEDTLSQKRRAELEDVVNLVPDVELADLFRLKYDYHSAKAMVKSDGSAKHLLSFDGRVEAAEFLRAYLRRELTVLPVTLAEAIHEAKSMLSRTGNPCLADLILDRAYFTELTETARRTGMPFAVEYVRLLIDCANLRALIRGKLAGKRPEIIGELLFEEGSILKESIIAAADSSDDIVRLFAPAGLGTAAEKGVAVLDHGSMTEFELALDNAVNDYLSDAERVGFGPAAVISYLAAVENQVMTLRIILTGKKTGIAPDKLRERLRECYI